MSWVGAGRHDDDPWAGDYETDHDDPRSDSGKQKVCLGCGFDAKMDQVMGFCNDAFHFRAVADCATHAG